jgi:electron transfer flavoprotein alpha subunit
MTARADILVVVETAEGRADPRAAEAIACARAIQAIRGGDFAAVVVDDDPAGVASDVAKRHGIPVLAVRVPRRIAGDDETTTAALTDVTRDVGATTVCLAHGSRASGVAPRLAASRAAACITSVEGVETENGAIVLKLRLYGGKIVARVRPLTERLVLTVAPGAFPPAVETPSAPGKVTERTFAVGRSQTRVLGTRIAEPADPGLAEAEVIVSAGRGIGAREGLALVERLATLFPKSAVGGSRPVCDAEWLPYRRQVGLTGATVAPRLYLACGIAGASQHVAGMRGAGFVVAINRDPEAAIFQVADVGVVEDVRAFLPLLIRAIESE